VGKKEAFSETENASFSMEIVKQERLFGTFSAVRATVADWFAAAACTG